MLLLGPDGIAPYGCAATSFSEKLKEILTRKVPGGRPEVREIESFI